MNGFLRAAAAALCLLPASPAAASPSSGNLEPFARARTASARLTRNARFNALLDRAQKAEDRGAYAAAADLRRRALALLPDHYAPRVALAEDEVRLGRLDLARSDFALARKADPKMAEAYVEEGYADVNAGQPDAAERAFSALVAADPSNPQGYHHLAAFWSRRGDFAKAEGFMRKSIVLLEADPRAHVEDLLGDLQWLGAILESEGRWPDAEAVYRDGLSRAKTSPDFQATFIAALASRQSPQEARASLEKAAAVCRQTRGCGPTTIGPILVRLAGLYMDESKTARARAALSEAGNAYGALDDGNSLGLDENAEKYIALGRAYEKLGDETLAERWFLRVLALSRALSSSPQLRAARKALADLYAGSARRLDEGGDRAGAAAAYRKALALRPREYALWVALAADEVELGRLSEARTDFAAARRLDSRQAQAYVREGYADFHAGDQKDADKLFAAAIVADPSGFAGYHHMAAYLDMSGREAQAEPYIRKSLAILEADPKSNRQDLFHSLEWLAAILKDDGKLAQAATANEDGLKRSQGDATYQGIFSIQLAQVYEAQGKNAQAEAAYRRAIDACRAPRSCEARARAPAWVGLARLLASEGRKSAASAAAAEALSELSDSLGKSPEDVYGKVFVLSQAADAYREIGADADAERVLRSILACGSSPIIADAVESARKSLAALEQTRARRRRPSMRPTRPPIITSTSR